MARRQVREIPWADITHDPFLLSGGLDVVTPPLSLKPGFCRESQNWECSITGGYSTIIGYERYDGRPRPSAAVYAILNVTITGSFAVGNTITGVTSGATAVVIAVVTTVSPNYLAITKIVGTFVSGETLNVAAVPQGTTSSTAVVGAASTALLNAQYLNLAADQYRTDILAIPGSGIVRGIWLFNNVRYAFRNNAGGTACDLYKSTATGWSLVAFGEEVSFTVGTGSVDDGDILTQGAVTATVQRVVVQSGSLGAGTAAGRLIITGRAGGNFGAGAATTTGGGTLTLSGIQTAITLSPSGRFEFVNSKIGGSPKRVYGCDGVNRGFEFDGTVFVPIVTGMSPDTPKYVSAHKNHLFFAFSGSAQHSGTGFPYQWTLLTGAAELAVGDTITGFMVEPGSAAGGALGIYSRNRVSILYGSSSANWVLSTYRDEVGAYDYSIQQLGYTIFVDDRGITSLQTTQTYGNFQHSTLSQRIQTLINAKRTKTNASCIVRNKNQYRLFFNDKFGLYLSFHLDKLIGIMPVQLLHKVECICSLEANDGSEEIYFGSDDGFVYQMEKGTSFDGADIETFWSLAFNNSKSPRQRKRYRQAMFEASGLGYSEFQFSYLLGYGTTDISQPASAPSFIPVVTNLQAPFWDTFVWDAFIWDGQILFPSEVDLEGTAENISLIVRSKSDYFFPLTLSSAIVHFSPRRSIR